MNKAIDGQVAYHAGRCAEDQVAAEYERRGHSIVGRRWRGKSGEIDLIAKDGGTLIFVEVKAARSHRQAAERINQRQMKRVYAAALEYVDGEPDGSNTDMRFDVALLDRTGVIDIIENAFM